jgi:L-ribulose-5-phosphate 4-epimerase
MSDADMDGQRSERVAELRRQVAAANRRLPDEGLITLTWGNVSGRLDNDVAIKPSGVPYAVLTAADMVVLSMAGQVTDGDLKPSTDTPSHLALYRAFPAIGGVVHVHSPYATAFAQARRPIPCLGTTHADHFAGPVPVTRALTSADVADYETTTGAIIVDHFRTEGIDPEHVPGVLVAGHAPFVWGPTVAKAVDNAVALEQIARMVVLSETVVGGSVTALEPHVLDVHHQRKHGPNAYYGQAVAADPQHRRDQFPGR